MHPYKQEEGSPCDIVAERSMQLQDVESRTVSDDLVVGPKVFPCRVLPMSPGLEDRCACGH